MRCESSKGREEISPRGGAVDKTVVLIGNSGSGKSATGNTIIGRQVFDSMPSSGGVASTCQLVTTALDDGQILNVIDTPGFVDSSVGKYEMAEEILECINMAKDGIHAFLIVVSLRRLLWDEEAYDLENLCQIIGGKIADYMIVVLTDGDILLIDSCLDDLRQYRPQIFEIQTLKMCGDRVVLFDNITDDEDEKYRQRKQLLSLVETVVEINGGKPYTNDLLDVQKRREMNLIDQSAEGKFHALNEEQFDRFTEMVESRLKESILNLEKQLGDERAARVVADVKAHVLQTTSKSEESIQNLEKQLAEEWAARTEAEMKSLAFEVARMETEMKALSLETKLKGEAHELKICLNRAEESRKQLEERLNRVESTHKLEKQLAEESASRLEVETKLKGEVLELKECLNSAEESRKQLQERLHRVEKQLAEESAARMEAQMKALSVQTKTKDDVLELKECFYKAEESLEPLEERLDKVESIHTLEKQLADEERASRLEVETKSKGEALELKECLSRAEESRKQLEERLHRVEKQLAEESAARMEGEMKVLELKGLCRRLEDRLYGVESRLDDVECGY